MGQPSAMQQTASWYRGCIAGEFVFFLKSSCCIWPGTYPFRSLAAFFGVYKIFCK